MLKRRRNARCTAVADSVLINPRTQKFLCCKVAILLHGCAIGERSSGGIWKFRTSSFKYYVGHSHTMYSSGNTDVRNWAHLFESPCILQGAETLHAQTSYGDKRDRKKNLSRNYTTDASLQRYGPSYWVWVRLKSSKTTDVRILKKKVFRTNLEQMLERTATDLDTQPTTTQQSLMCAFKMPGCWSLSDTANKILFHHLTAT
jgi:hypothetical protein